MAAARANPCDICMHDFNEADRKCVTLPCGHDFCLTCLVRLKTSGSHKCPKCRGDWAEVEVAALPGMEDVDEEAGARQVEEEELDEKVKLESDLCLNHQLPYLYWCVDENEFHCKKCIVEKRCLQLELIDEAIPLIKTDLSRRVTDKLDIFQSDLAELEQMKYEVSGKLHITKQYKGAVQKVEDDLQDCVTEIEVRIVEKRMSLGLAEDIRQRIEEVKSELDVPLVIKSRTTLEALSKPTAVPNVDVSQALLCNIALTYMVTGLESPPFEAAFIHGLLKTSESSIGPLTEVVRAAEDLKGGKEWSVDSSNCLAALLALADRQPRLLTLIARPDEHEALPAAAVAVVAKAARDSEVTMHFLDTFYAPQEPKKDLERLNHIVKNSSLRLTSLFGHLDEAGIAMLPRTISSLGLAIGSAADARAISDLHPWEELLGLTVSVSCGIAAQDLRPLPSVLFTCLYFPDLTDDRVDGVRPAIEALVGDRGLNILRFPACQLTAGGTRRLARLLRGVDIGMLTIEASGPWQPEDEERGSLEAEFSSVVECGVKFVPPIDR